MMGALSTEASADELLAHLRDRTAAYDTVDWVRRVTTPEPYTWGPEARDARYRVSVLDCGVKYNITVTNQQRICKGVAKISLNGKPVTGSVIRAAEGLHEVSVEVEIGL